MSKIIDRMAKQLTDETMVKVLVNTGNTKQALKIWLESFEPPEFPAVSVVAGNVLSGFAQWKKDALTQIESL